MTRRFAPLLCFSLALAALPASAAPDSLTVAVYAGPGTSPDDVAKLESALAADATLDVHLLASVQGGTLKSDPLDGVDVLVVGGGSGTALGKGLGVAGGATLEAFVRNGGGYVGLGAGAYLGARGYNAGTRNLELVDAALFNRGAWKLRGEGEVVLAPTRGQPLGALPKSMFFSKGPLFVPARGLGSVPYTSAATFVTDLNAGHKTQDGVMVGADAAVCARFGRGRALLLSVLPHYTSAGAAFLPQAIRWAGGEGAAPEASEPEAAKGALKVAVLDDEGCIGGCVLGAFKCLDQRPDAFWTRRVSAEQIRAGVLATFDVVLLPGGSANKQTAGLLEPGREAIRAFVRDGGAYVGICAGAYMGASEPAHYGLGLAAVRCADTKHWRRGGDQLVETKASPTFNELSGRPDETQRLYYMNGPLLEPMQVEGLAPVEPLLTYVSDVHTNDAPAGVMPGKLAALRTEFGKGRVVLYSVHPELTKGFEETLVRSTLWAARRPLD